MPMILNLCGQDRLCKRENWCTLRICQSEPVTFDGEGLCLADEHKESIFLLHHPWITAVHLR